MEKAVESLGFTIMDHAGGPPGQIAHFPSCGNLVRNVAVLRAGLCSLYEEVKRLEADLPQGIHHSQDFDVNGKYAMLAVKFDWFSVSMLNLMEGISLLDTVTHEGRNYVELVGRNGGMKLIRLRARTYTESIPEARPLRQWRNKVAAHRSGIVQPPRGKGDSMVTRLISLMGAQVMAKNGRFVAPAAKPGGVGPDPSSSELPEWSLTETWESLARGRYEWLNDGDFFEGVSLVQLGGGSGVRAIEAVSGAQAVEAFMKKHGLERPKD